MDQQKNVDPGTCSTWKITVTIIGSTVAVYGSAL